ncbi:chloride channel CLIC-like protein 1 [Amia ocellicauda]|uniref:chloride channel CLIC-like protein 1 n=1 Tax=Amia ocellicauda TaxID=2972642 RepID=UPI0034641614
MLLLGVMCAVLAAPVHGEQADGWLDHTDMLNYDDASKTMKKSAKEQNNQAGNVPPHGYAEDEDDRGCRTRLALLQWEIKNLKEQAEELKKPNADFRRELNNLLSDIHQLPNGHEEDSHSAAFPIVVYCHEMISAISTIIGRWKWFYEDTFYILEPYKGLLAIVISALFVFWSAPILLRKLKGNRKAAHQNAPRVDAVPQDLLDADGRQNNQDGDLFQAVDHSMDLSNHMAVENVRPEIPDERNDEEAATEEHRNEEGDVPQTDEITEGCAKSMESGTYEDIKKKPIQETKPATSYC